MLELRAILLAALVSMGAVLGFSAASAQTAGEVVIVTTGGSADAAFRRHFYNKFERQTGIKVVMVGGTAAERSAKLAAMSEANKISWDVVLLGDPEYGPLSKFFEPIGADCAALLKNDLVKQDVKGGCLDFAIRANTYCVCLSYRSDAFEGEQPRTWVDLFDIKRFPGQRGLPNQGRPHEILAMALLADGVPPSKLTPFDYDRAFGMLDRIKSTVVWWKTGDQSQQLLRSNEVQLGAFWESRVTQLMSAGVPVSFTWRNALIDHVLFGIVKGGPNTENARKFLEFYLSEPEAQAGYATEMSVVPPSTTANEMLARAPATKLLTLVEIAKAEPIYLDTAWIAANSQETNRRWNEWISR